MANETSPENTFLDAPDVKVLGAEPGGASPETSSEQVPGKVESHDDDCQATTGEAASGRRVCCCKHKETPRSQEFQADLQRRLNRVIGQLNGVKQMIDDNRYCGDVLVQLSAAETAVHNVAFAMLQDHMSTCVVDRIRQGDDAIVDEAMQLIKRFSK